MWCLMYGFTNELLLHSGLKWASPGNRPTFLYTHMNAPAIASEAVGAKWDAFGNICPTLVTLLLAVRISQNG